MSAGKAARRPASWAFAVALSLAGTAALPQEPASPGEPQWPLQVPEGSAIDLSPKQMFVLSVNGAGTGFNQRGTAFAIDARVLITARHVVGEHTAFRDKAPNSPNIHIPDRASEIEYAPDESGTQDAKTYDSMSVTPAPIPTVDAARIDLAGLFVTPMSLSACEIDVRERFFLLKLKDGDVDAPRAVALTPDVETFTGRGDLRLFTHSAPARDAPTSGDSGAPVVDPTGRVVGLLTAIGEEGSKEVYVSLTRTWLDLVPSGVPVDCDPRVRPDQIAELKGDVERLETALQDRILQLEEALAANEASVNEVDGRARDMIEAESLRVGELAKTVNWLNTKTNSVEKRSDVVLSAMANTEENIADIVEELRVIIDAALPEVDPEKAGILRGDMDYLSKVVSQLDGPKLVPTVRRIREHLSRPHLRLDVEWNARGLRQELSYARELAAPPLADSLIFCLRPIFPYGGDTVAANIPTEKIFFDKVVLDEDGRVRKDDNIDTIPCQPTRHDSDSASGAHLVTNGRFAYELPLDYMLDVFRDDFEDRRALEDIGDEEWDGRAYLSVHKPAEDAESTEPYEVIMRAVILLDQDAGPGYPDGVTPCRSFDSVDEIIGFLTQQDAQLEQPSPCHPEAASP